ncbi:MAG TPA: hypothetical protein VJR06_01160 [Nitrososphaerales archaeon]|nr:hypothetical protein [Nitrososphaerales archaeon]
MPHKSSFLGPPVLKELGPTKARKNDVIVLVTVGKEGRPGVCLLSPFQVIASDRRTIHLAVYKGSRTDSNLSERGKATLAIFLPPAAYYVEGDVAKAGSLASALPSGNVHYRFTVSGVFKDYYEKAPITSKVTFDETEILGDYRRVFSSLAEAAARS